MRHPRARCFASWTLPLSNPPRMFMTGSSSSFFFSGLLHFPNTAPGSLLVASTHHRSIDQKHPRQSTHIIGHIHMGGRVGFPLFPSFAAERNHSNTNEWRWEKKTQKFKKSCKKKKRRTGSRIGERSTDEGHIGGGGKQNQPPTPPASSPLSPRILVAPPQLVPQLRFLGVQPGLAFWLGKS
ncbi:hypothetical protein BC567DRAFT_78958 [Phyllosticta citribraziliensis]